MTKLHCFRLLLFGILIWLYPFFVNAQKKAQPQEPYISRDHLGSIDFIENKGQHPTQVLFNAVLPFGNLFLESNRLTFVFVDPHDVSHSKAHHASLKNAPQDNEIHFHAYHIHFLNCKKKPDLLPLQPTPDYVNYFKGKDPTHWATDVRQYKMVLYRELYRKIDLLLYSDQHGVKYDFIIRPGGNPLDIQLAYEGVDSLRVIDEQLVTFTSVNEITECKPLTFQSGQTKNQTPVRCAYQLDHNLVSFALPDGYDPRNNLTIDPGLRFSTYTGSTADNWGFTATFDEQGNVYSGGIVDGVGYPVTIGAFQENPVSDPAFSYQWDIGIMKFDSTGKNRLYATYLSGSSTEMPHSLIVNGFNELIILGTTGSADFPVTAAAYDTSYNGGTALIYDNVLQFSQGTDIFVAKLNSSGNQLLASTFVGGSQNDGINFRARYNNLDIQHGIDSLYYNYGDGARGEIITDDLNNVYIGTCTFSSNFPVSPTAFQSAKGGRQEGVVFKLDYSLSSLVWSSFLGGAHDDAVYSIDTDDNYDLYVTGGTSSTDFPTTLNATQPIYNGGTTDGFVAKISRNGNSLISSSFFGSDRYDQSYFVRVSKRNHVYLFGQTAATGSTLIKNALYNTPNSGQFLAKLTPALDSVIWSTVFGTGNGKPNISPTAFAVDICNRVYLSGWGREWAEFNNWGSIQGTKNMDITANAAQSVTDGQDFYIMVMADDASAINYGTFLGEIHYNGCSYSGHDHVDGGTSRFDKRGNIYQSVCASCGMCDQFPTTPGVWSNNNRSGNCNNAVFKIDINFDFTLADFDMPEIECVPAVIHFNNKSSGSLFTWDFGDGSPLSHEKNPIHTFTKAGAYTVMLIADDSVSCNLADTAYRQIQVLDNQVYSLEDVEICMDDFEQIGLPPNPDPDITYRWTPPTNLSNPRISNPFVFPTDNTQYLLEVSNGICTDSIFVYVKINNLGIFMNTDNIEVCPGETFYLAAVSPFSEVAYRWSANRLFTDLLNGSTDNGTAAVTATTSAYYYFHGTNGICEYIDSVYVFVSVPTASLDIQDTRCHHTTDGSILATPSGGLAPYSYLWSTGGTAQQITALLPGNYFVTVTDSLGCTYDTVGTVSVPSPLASQLTGRLNNCIESCNGMSFAHVSGGLQPYIYEWSSGDTDSVAVELCTGLHRVTVTDRNACMTYDSITISDSATTYYALAITTTRDTIYESESLQLTGTFYEQHTYLWQPMASLLSPTNHTTIASPATTTQYNLTMTDSFGCQWLDTVEVFVKKVICGEPHIFVPNAFTPNNDLMNDQVYVRGNAITELYFAIYNRWGELVFETTSQDNGWDGSFKDEPCNPGVFVYYLQATCIGDFDYIKKGNITLIR